MITGAVFLCVKLSMTYPSKNPFGHLCPYSLPGRGQGEGDTPACRQRVGMVPEKIKTENDTAPT